jgi:hypothetical protein
VLGQVARTLELGHDADQGEHEPELAGHRCLQEQQALDAGLELDHQLVDGLLSSAHLGQRVRVVGHQRGVGGGDGLTDQREQADDLLVDLVQLAVVPDAELHRLVRVRHELAPTCSAAQPFRRL